MTLKPKAKPLPKSLIQENNIINQANSNSDISNLLSEAQALNDLLNQVSDKFQILEDGLQKCNANFSFSILIGKKEASPLKKPQEEHLSLGYSHIDSYCTFKFDLLSWEADPETNDKKFRLFLVTQQEDEVYYGYGEDEYSGAFVLPPTTISKIPVRQTKLQVRLYLSKYFDSFVKKFTEELSNKRLELEYYLDFPEDVLRF